MTPKRLMIAPRSSAAESCGSAMYGNQTIAARVMARRPTRRRKLGGARYGGVMMYGALRIVAQAASVSSNVGDSK